VSGHAIAIEIRDLVKDYQGLRPLRVEKLAVRARDRVALSGFDATAAEVLVNIVNGAILPDRGEVRVFGKPTAAIADETEWFASLDRFGIVTPRAVLLESATVRQNLALPFTIDLDHLDEETRRRIESIADEVGLAPAVRDQRVEQVPIEGRMRIHLGRAVATNPQVLLLEHPTAPMPREYVPAFAASVKQVADARGLTLVAITEDAEFADVVATAHFRVQGGTGSLVNARGWRRWLG
jgi:ABC-type lipoprotein export system ATPase subunit